MVLLDLEANFNSILNSSQRIVGLVLILILSGLNNVVNTTRAPS